MNKKGRPLAEQFRTLDDPPAIFSADPSQVRDIETSKSDPASLYSSVRFQSKLVITPECAISTAGPMPNAWRRFWTWALLGWRWEKMP